MKKFISTILLVCFLTTSVIPPQLAQAQAMPVATPTILGLPTIGQMVPISPAFKPAILKGINIDPDNPLHFDFIIDQGDSSLVNQELEDESMKLIKYFLASLTTPEDQMWVNLSPHEKNKIIPDSFARTNMGRDLLAQDYLLKQLTASLMYPEEDLGQEFWERVRKESYKQFGTRDVPVNTFNKVWIVPEWTNIFEHEKGAVVVNSHLKVLLEKDYVAKRNSDQFSVVSGQNNDLHAITEMARTSINPDHRTQNTDHRPNDLSADIIREIIVPAIEREVNEGKTFAPLRQIFNSMILATWYKQNLKESLLAQVYVDQQKTFGTEHNEEDVVNQIYNQYIESFKTGVFNYIKEDYDPVIDDVIPRKYFSGGVSAELQNPVEQGTRSENDLSLLPFETRFAYEDIIDDLEGDLEVSVDLTPEGKDALELKRIAQTSETDLSILADPAKSLIATHDPTDVSTIKNGPFILDTVTIDDINYTITIHEQMSGNSVSILLFIDSDPNKKFDSLEERKEKVLAEENGRVIVDYLTTQDTWSIIIFHPVNLIDSKFNKKFRGHNISKKILRYIIAAVLENNKWKLTNFGTTKLGVFHSYLSMRKETNWPFSMRIFKVDEDSKTQSVSESNNPWIDIDSVEYEELIKTIFDQELLGRLQLETPEDKYSFSVMFDALGESQYVVTFSDDEDILSEGDQVEILFSNGEITREGEFIGTITDTTSDLIVHSRPAARLNEAQTDEEDLSRITNTNNRRLAAFEILEALPEGTQITVPELVKLLLKLPHIKKASNEIVYRDIRNPSSPVYQHPKIKRVKATQKDFADKRKQAELKILDEVETGSQITLNDLHDKLTSIEEFREVTLETVHTDYDIKDSLVKTHPNLLILKKQRIGNAKKRRQAELEILASIKEGEKITLEELHKRLILIDEFSEVTLKTVRSDQEEKESVLRDHPKLLILNQSRKQFADKRRAAEMKIINSLGEDEELTLAELLDKLLKNKEYKDVTSKDLNNDYSNKNSPLYKHPKIIKKRYDKDFMNSRREAEFEILESLPINEKISITELHQKLVQIPKFKDVPLKTVDSDYDREVSKIYNHKNIKREGEKNIEEAKVRRQTELRILNSLSNGKQLTITELHTLLISLPGYPNTPKHSVRHDYDTKGSPIYKHHRIKVNTHDREFIAKRREVQIHILKQLQEDEQITVSDLHEKLTKQRKFSSVPLQAVIDDYKRENSPTYQHPKINPDITAQNENQKSVFPVEKWEEGDVVIVNATGDEGIIYGKPQKRIGASRLLDYIAVSSSAIEYIQPVTVADRKFTFYHKANDPFYTPETRKKTIQDIIEEQEETITRRELVEIMIARGYQTYTLIKLDSDLSSPQGLIPSKSKISSNGNGKNKTPKGENDEAKLTAVPASEWKEGDVLMHLATGRKTTLFGLPTIKMNGDNIQMLAINVGPQDYIVTPEEAEKLFRHVHGKTDKLTNAKKRIKTIWEVLNTQYKSVTPAELSQLVRENTSYKDYPTRNIYADILPFYSPLRDHPKLKIREIERTPREEVLNRQTIARDFLNNSEEDVYPEDFVSFIKGRGFTNYNYDRAYKDWTTESSLIYKHPKLLFQQFNTPDSQELANRRNAGAAILDAQDKPINTLEFIELMKTQTPHTDYSLAKVGVDSRAVNSPIYNHKKLIIRQKPMPTKEEKEHRRKVGNELLQQIGKKIGIGEYVKLMNEQGGFPDYSRKNAYVDLRHEPLKSNSFLRYTQEDKARLTQVPATEWKLNDILLNQETGRKSTVFGFPQRRNGGNTVIEQIAIKSGSYENVLSKQEADEQFIFIRHQKDPVNELQSRRELVWKAISETPGEFTLDRVVEIMNSKHPDVKYTLTHAKNDFLSTSSFLHNHPKIDSNIKKSVIRDQLTKFGYQKLNGLSVSKSADLISVSRGGLSQYLLKHPEEYEKYGIIRQEQTPKTFAPLLESFGFERLNGQSISQVARLIKKDRADLSKFLNNNPELFDEYGIIRGKGTPPSELPALLDKLKDRITGKTISEIAKITKYSYSYLNTYFNQNPDEKEKYEVALAPIGQPSKVEIALKKAGRKNLKGLNQRQVALKINISPTTITRYFKDNPDKRKYYGIIRTTDAEKVADRIARKLGKFKGRKFKDVSISQTAKLIDEAPQALSDFLLKNPSELTRLGIKKGIAPKTTQTKEDDFGKLTTIPTWSDLEAEGYQLIDLSVVGQSQNRLVHYLYEVKKDGQVINEDDLYTESHISLFVRPKLKIVHLAQFFPQFPSKDNPDEYREGRGRALLREILKQFPGYDVTGIASLELRKSLRKMPEFFINPNNPAISRITSQSKPTSIYSHPTLGESLRKLTSQLKSLESEKKIKEKSLDILVKQLQEANFHLRVPELKERFKDEWRISSETARKIVSKNKKTKQQAERTISSYLSTKIINNLIKTFKELDEGYSIKGFTKHNFSNIFAHAIPNAIDSYLQRQESDPNFTEPLIITTRILEDSENYYLQIINNGTNIVEAETTLEKRSQEKRMGGSGNGLYNIEKTIINISYDAFKELRARDDDQDGAILEITIPKGEKLEDDKARLPPKYFKLEHVLEGLAKRTEQGLENFPSVLMKKESEGGDWSLYRAAQRFEIKLPIKERERKYPTKESVEQALAQRLELGLENFATTLNTSQALNGNPLLYRTALQFNIKLPFKTGTESKAYLISRYPTKEVVEQELANRLERGLKNSASALNSPITEGGDSALYRRARKLHVMLPTKAKESETELARLTQKYNTKTAALNELKARTKRGLRNDPVTLGRAKNRGGDIPLLNATNLFNIALPTKEEEDLKAKSIRKPFSKLRTKKYPTKESVEQELKARIKKGLENDASSLMKNLNIGGDRPLRKAAEQHNVELPKRIRDKDTYPKTNTAQNKEIRPEYLQQQEDIKKANQLKKTQALTIDQYFEGDVVVVINDKYLGKKGEITGKPMRRIKGELVEHLSVAVEGYHDTAVLDAVDVRKAPSEKDKSILSKYPTIESVEQELERRANLGLENTSTALNLQQIQGGDITLYRSAKQFGVQLNRRNAEPNRYKTYNDVINELDRRIDSGLNITKKALRLNVDQGGDYALYNATIQFGIDLPEIEQKKYPTLESVEFALKERLLRNLENHSTALRAPKSDGGNWTLYNSARRFQIPLPLKLSKSRDGFEHAPEKIKIKNGQLLKLLDFATKLFKETPALPIEKYEEEEIVFIVDGLYKGKTGEITGKPIRLRTSGLTEQLLVISMHGYEETEVLKPTQVRKLTPEILEELDLSRMTKYPTIESVEAELNARLERGLDNYPSTLDLRLDEGGDKALHRAAKAFGIILPIKRPPVVSKEIIRGKRLGYVKQTDLARKLASSTRLPIESYTIGEEVIIIKGRLQGVTGIITGKPQKRFKRSLFSHLSINMHGFDTELVFDPTFVRKLELSSEDISQMRIQAKVDKYPTRILVEKELFERIDNGLSNNPASLKKKAEDGGDKILYTAAREFEIELPKVRRENNRFQSIEATKRELILRMKRGLGISSSDLTATSAENGDYTLYQAAKKFNLKIPNQRVKNKYPSKEIAQQELDRRLSNGMDNTPSSLYNKDKDNYDPALYRAALRFKIELPKTQIVKYPTIESVQEALELRSHRGLGNNPAELEKRIEDGGDRALVIAAKKFDVPLASKIKYPTKILAEEELVRRENRGLKNTTLALRATSKEGGDRALSRAVDKFNIELPRDRGIHNKYEKKEAAIAQLRKRKERGLENYARTLQLSIREGGDLSLYKAAVKHSIELPTHIKYPTKKSVQEELAVRIKMGLENTSTALNKPLAENGDESLHKAALEFEVPLPKKKRKPGKYPSKEAVEIELSRRHTHGLKNNARALNKTLSENGDQTLYDAAKKFGVELPLANEEIDLGKLGSGKYTARMAVINELIRRQQVGLENHADALINRLKAEGGDQQLYKAAHKFRIPLPKKPGGVERRKYDSSRDVLDELDKREKIGLDNTSLALRAAIKFGGDPTLLEATRRFDIKLSRKIQKKYPTKQSVEDELLKRSQQGLKNTSTALHKKIEDGGDRPLERAAKKFGIQLPPKKSYPTRDDVLIAFTVRSNKGLSNDSSALNARIEDGGDKGLWNAAKEFDVTLPRKKKETKSKSENDEAKLSKYPTKESAQEELKRREELGLENTATTLKSSKSLGGDKTLFRAIKKFNIDLPSKQASRNRYTTIRDVLTELESRIKRGLENHATALLLNKEEGGDSGLYRAAKKLGVEIPEISKKKMTEEKVIQALANRTAAGFLNTAESLSKPKEQGGNETLYKYSLEYEIELPKTQRRDTKYLTVQEVEDELAFRIIKGLSNNPSVLARKPISEGGNYALYKSARRLGVPLDVQKSGEKIYTSKEEVQEELKRRAELGLSNNAKALKENLDNNGDNTLYNAAREFKVKLPNLIATPRIYSSAEDVKRGMYNRLRKGLGNRAKDLNKRRDLGGNFSLLESSKKYKVPYILDPIEIPEDSIEDYEEGDMVRVVDGKLKGYLGIVTGKPMRREGKILIQQIAVVVNRVSGINVLDPSEVRKAILDEEREKFFNGTIQIDKNGKPKRKVNPKSYAQRIPSLLEEHADEIKGLSISKAARIMKVSASSLAKHLKENTQNYQNYGLIKANTRIADSLRENKSKIKGKNINQIATLLGMTHQGLNSYFKNHPEEIELYGIIKGKGGQQKSNTEENDRAVLSNAVMINLGIQPKTAERLLKVVSDTIKINKINRSFWGDATTLNEEKIYFTESIDDVDIETYNSTIRPYLKRLRGYRGRLSIFTGFEATRAAEQIINVTDRWIEQKQYIEETVDTAITNLEGPLQENDDGKLSTKQRLEQSNGELKGLNISQAAEKIGITRAGLSAHFIKFPAEQLRYGIIKGAKSILDDIPNLLEKHKYKVADLTVPKVADILGVRVESLRQYLSDNPDAYTQYKIIRYDNTKVANSLEIYSARVRGETITQAALAIGVSPSSLARHLRLYPEKQEEYGIIRGHNPHDNKIPNALEEFKEEIAGQPIKDAAEIMGVTRQGLSYHLNNNPEDKEYYKLLNGQDGNGNGQKINSEEDEARLSKIPGRLEEHRDIIKGENLKRTAGIIGMSRFTLMDYFKDHPELIEQYDIKYNKKQSNVPDLLEDHKADIAGKNITETARIIKRNPSGLRQYLIAHPELFEQYDIVIGRNFGHKNPSIDTLFEENKESIKGKNLSETAIILSVNPRTLDNHLKKFPEKFTQFEIQENWGDTLPEHVKHLFGIGETSEEDEGKLSKTPQGLEDHKEEIKGLSIKDTAELIGVSTTALSRYIKRYPNMLKKYGIIRSSGGREGYIGELLTEHNGELAGLSITKAAQKINVSRIGLRDHLRNYPDDYATTGIVFGEPGRPKKEIAQKDEAKLTQIKQGLEDHKDELQGLNIGQAAKVIGRTPRGVSLHLQNNPNDFKLYGIVRGTPYKQADIPKLLKEHADLIIGLNITQTSEAIGVSAPGLSKHLKKNPRDFERFAINKDHGRPFAYIPRLLEQYEEDINGLNIKQASRAIGVSESGLNKHLKLNPEDLTRYNIVKGPITFDEESATVSLEEIPFSALSEDDLGRLSKIPRLLEKHKDEIKGLHISQTAKLIGVSLRGLMYHLKRFPDDFERYELVKGSASKIPKLLEQHKEDIRGFNISETANLIGVSLRGIQTHLQDNPDDFERYELVKGSASKIPKLLEQYKEQIKELNISKTAEVIGITNGGLFNHLKKNPDDFEKYGIVKDIRGQKFITPELLEQYKEDLEGLNISQAAELLDISNSGLGNYFKKNPEERIKYSIIDGRKKKEASEDDLGRLSKIPGLLEKHKEDIRGLNISQVASVIKTSLSGLQEHLKKNPNDFDMYNIIKIKQGGISKIPALIEKHKDKIKGRSITQVAVIIDVSRKGVSEHLKTHPNNFEKYGIIRGKPGRPKKNTETDKGILSDTPGGIDFNAEHLDMNIDKQGDGVRMPITPLQIRNLQIDGFIPTIINITPITNVPLLLGLNEESLRKLTRSTETPIDPNDPFAPCRELPIGEIQGCLSKRQTIGDLSKIHSY